MIVVLRSFLLSLCLIGVWAETVTIDVNGSVEVRVAAGGTRSVALANSSTTDSPGQIGGGFTVSGSGSTLTITHTADGGDGDSGASASCTIMTSQGPFTLSLSLGSDETEAITVRFNDGAGGGGTDGDGGGDGPGTPPDVDDPGTVPPPSSRQISAARVSAAVRSDQLQLRVQDNPAALRNTALDLDGWSGGVPLGRAIEIVDQALGFYRDFHVRHSASWWGSFTGYSPLVVRPISIVPTRREPTLLSFGSARSLGRFGKALYAELMSTSGSHSMVTTSRVVGETTPPDFVQRARRIATGNLPDPDDMGLIYGVLHLARRDATQIATLDMALDRRRSTIDLRLKAIREEFVAHRTKLDKAWIEIERLPALTPKPASGMQIRDLELFWRELVLTACSEADDVMRHLGDEESRSRELAELMHASGTPEMRATGEFPPFETLLGPLYPPLVRKALVWAGSPNAGANVLPPINLPSQRLLGCAQILFIVLAEFEAYYPDEASGDLPNPETSDRPSVQKYLCDVRQVLDMLYAKRPELRQLASEMSALAHEVGRADVGGERRDVIASLTKAVERQIPQIYAQFETLEESTSRVPVRDRGTRTPLSLLELEHMESLESRRLVTAIQHADFALQFLGEDPDPVIPGGGAGGARIDQKGMIANQCYDTTIRTMLQGARQVLGVYQASLSSIPRLADLEQQQWDCHLVNTWLRHARTGNVEPQEVHDLLGMLRRERIAYHQALTLWLATMRRYGQRRLRDIDFYQIDGLQPMGPKEDPAVGTTSLQNCYVVQRHLILNALAFPAYQHVSAHILALQQSLVDREALYLAIRAARAATSALEDGRASSAKPNNPIPLNQ